MRTVREEDEKIRNQSSNQPKLTEGNKEEDDISITLKMEVGKEEDLENSLYETGSKKGRLEEHMDDDTEKCVRREKRRVIKIPNDPEHEGQGNSQNVIRSSSQRKTWRMILRRDC